MAWGRKPSCLCGECPKCKRRIYMRAYYHSKTPEERRRIFVSGRDPERVKRVDAERYKNMSDEERHRRHVNSTLRNAVRDGYVEKLPCEVCGATGSSVHGHHDDYSKPLEVRWLCTVHHAEVHMGAF